MLLQSHAGELELLPALPPAWPEGSVSGLRARGGFEADLTWKSGSLVRVVLRSKRGGRCLMRYGSKTSQLAMRPGASIALDGRLRPR
jgi:alpha-L-fucosidase 2